MRVEASRYRDFGLRGRGLFIGGSLVLVLLVLAGGLAPWLAPYKPEEQPSDGQLRPPLTVLPAVQLSHSRWLVVERVERTADGLLIERRGGVVERLSESEVMNLTPDGVAHRRVYLLGSDKLGRDVLSRLLYGARMSLFVGTVAVTLALSIGVAVGALAALGGALLDGLLMRLVDGLLTLPWLFVLVALAALIQPSPSILALIIGGSAWMSISRIVRGEIASLRERDFILAVRGLGAGPLRIFFRHLLPHVLTPLVVTVTLRMARVIVAEASISFLGLGILPPDASWGNMIDDGRAVIFSAWWIAGWPALALTCTVIALSLVGDGLRDLLDPQRA